VTPAGRGAHIARLERRDRRRDEGRRYVQRQAAMQALSDEQANRMVLLLRRHLDAGAEPPSAAETRELEDLLAPIAGLYEPDDELP
jgi:hypothetical protein